MSRIGRLAIAIPAGAKVSLEGQRVAVEGPKGKLALTVPNELRVAKEEQSLRVSIAGKEDARGLLRPAHGLYRALIANMVHGVTEGFSRELEITGVGYRAQLQGRKLSLTVGFSHPVVLDIPEGVTVEVPKPTTVIVKGADRQAVGQMATTIRGVAPPEPYKGKGIKFAGEQIRRKAGKAATGSGAKGGGGGK